MNFSTFIVLIVFANYAKSANILVFVTSTSYSHQLVFQPIWKELSLRGHNITAVTTAPLNDHTLTNLIEIDVSFTFKLKNSTEIEKNLGRNSNLFMRLHHIQILLNLLTQAKLECREIRDMLNSSRFDLILIQSLYSLSYGLAGKFKAPLIGVSSMGAPINGHENVGNSAHPALYPDLLLPFNGKNLSMWKKITSVSYYIWSKFYHQIILLPKNDKLVKKYFGTDIPYLGDLQKSQEILFMNTNPYIHTSRAMVPAVVEMGQMHIKPVLPLPKDLQTFLDDAQNGAVYFSLGTNVGEGNISDELMEIIIATLSDLPYKVIWKWNKEDFVKRDNVLVRKWLPQNDILAHPNVRVFVMQGGLQSLEEAITREVPLVGMPFLTDQPKNVERLVDLGIGLMVDPQTVTAEELKQSITKVAENDKYKRKIKELRKYLYDKPMTGLQKVVWWSEYILRHKGASHLKSPSADISWFKYLLIDVIAISSLILWVIFYFIFKIIYKIRS